MIRRNDKIARDRALDRTIIGQTPQRRSIERRSGRRRRDYESSKAYPNRKTVEQLIKYYWEDARSEPGWNLDDLSCGDS